MQGSEGARFFFLIGLVTELFLALIGWLVFLGNPRSWTWQQVFAQYGELTLVPIGLTLFVIYCGIKGYPETARKLIWSAVAAGIAILVLIVAVPRLDGMELTTGVIVGMVMTGIVIGAIAFFILVKEEQKKINPRTRPPRLINKVL